MSCERQDAQEKCRAAVSILHRHEAIGKGWVPAAVQACNAPPRGDPAPIRCCGHAVHLHFLDLAV